MKGLFIFAAGLVAGAVAGAYLVKDKVMTDAKAEIEEVREYYKSKKESKKEIEEKPEVNEEKENVEELVNEYEEIVKNSGYTNYNKMSEQPKVEKVSSVDMPYVIDPEEFGALDDYDTMTLTYFEDKVLVDDVDEVIDQPDPVVGLDNLKVFEEYGARSMYVRNDIWKIDFEIIKDDWNWSDLQEDTPGKKPHQL